MVRSGWNQTVFGILPFGRDETRLTHSWTAGAGAGGRDGGKVSLIFKAVDGLGGY